ncbi:hypothetical protein [Rhodoblastus sp.]|jgi:hypothetical protein|uniref:terminase small subunit-like protein n=1 Tax=Rhodoblastus sp. TaxID=1962975 RepID=UPI0025F7A6D2|nr:hypothetical protein [Rhodoblastus sp.]
MTIEFPPPPWATKPAPAEPEKPKPKLQLVPPVQAPVPYGDALARQIVELIASGASIQDVVALPGMPSMFILQRWRDQKPAFARAFEAARAAAADIITSERLTIVDAANADNVQVAALRSATRREIAACWSPREYGKTVQINQRIDQHVSVTGKVEYTIRPETTLEELLEMERMLQKIVMTNGIDANGMTDTVLEGEFTEE